VILVAGVTEVVLRLRESAIGKTALLQVEDIDAHRISRVITYTPTFCVKKWYNRAFTIHQFDNV